MHIPESMLHGAVCPVTLAVSALGIGVAVSQARQSKEKPSSGRFSAVTALVFAMQMLHYPVQHGTSGHLVGAILAVSLLGIPFAVLSMSLVLLVQAFFFGNGGVNALGANILNMAILGAGVMGLLFTKMKNKGISRSMAVMTVSWLSVMTGAAACSLEVASAGVISLQKVLPAMLGAHALMGVGEGWISLVVIAILDRYERLGRSHEGAFSFAALGIAAAAAIFSPFVNHFPDGLERVSEKLSFSSFPGAHFTALFQDYRVLFISHEALSALCAGMIGVLSISIAAYVLVSLSHSLKKW